MNLPHTKALLLSTSTLHGGHYLEYCKSQIVDHFHGVSEILFIPYARPSGISHDGYTRRAALFFETIGINIIGLHTFQDPKEALHKAQGVFTGGGNTFVLLQSLQNLGLVSVLNEVILSGQCIYMGSSAGTNLAGKSIGTTNDMPIVWPKSLDAIGIVPFNINPHYLDPLPESTHMGETRETRIKEFHEFNEQPVLGLREGSYLKIENNTVHLHGQLSARLFQARQEPQELSPGNISSYLL